MGIADLLLARGIEYQSHEMLMMMIMVVILFLVGEQFGPSWFGLFFHGPFAGE